MRKLYSHPLSGNAHRARLLLSMLKLPYEEVAVDLQAGAHLEPAFLAMNPLHQVPVLDDGGTVIRDSHAILVYLGGKYGGDAWWPQSAMGQGLVMQWLSYSANEIHHGPNLARLHFLLGRAMDVAAAQERTRAVLATIERHLDGRDWLELGRPTVADLACFPYVALAPEGRVALDPYPRVGGWIARVKALPGYVGMPGL